MKILKNRKNEDLDRGFNLKNLKIKLESHRQSPYKPLDQDVFHRRIKIV